MQKRIVSVVLSLCLIFGVCFSVSASSLNSDKTLRFDSNGELKIMHICDCQDGYPASKKMLSFMDAALKEYEPDLVILGGDNTVGSAETKEKAIEELTSVFVENEVMFTLVFGNHDYEQGVSNDEALKLYQKYGQGYCLAYDAVPELHGSATHNIPVLSSNGKEIKFNLWLFDSGSYVYDENDKRLGYDCVTEDQIEWYESVSKALEAEAGAKVPSLAFQHIIVGDVYDALFYESPIEISGITRSFNGKVYSFMPKTANFTGHLFEYPCPGYYNFGQLDSMAERGDVLGIFSGHDHTNTFETEIKGVKIINTPSATLSSYANGITRGTRLITVKESNPSTFESEIITYNDLVKVSDDFAEKAGITNITASFYTVIGDILLALAKLSSSILRDI